MIRLLIAEDQLMFRDAVKSFLEREVDITVVAEVSRADQVGDAASRSAADGALIDLEMPGGDGLEAVRALSEHASACRSLVVTAFARPGLLQRSLANGAAGFMVKNAPAAELVAAIRRCAQGQRVVDPKLAAEALALGPVPLSAGERAVLVAVTTGASVAQIANTLHLSQGTVRNRISESLSKLYARNRIDAVRIATQNGWI